MAKLAVPLLVLAFGQVLAAPAVRATPLRYTLDPTHSRLTIHVGKGGVFGFAGHEHEVTAGTFRGQVMFDPDQLANSSVELTFDTGALRVTAQGEPEGDVPQVQATMVGPTCLDASRFPTVRFVSKAVTMKGAAGGLGSGDRDVELAGELTLHGVTRSLTLAIHVAVEGGALVVTGSTVLRQSEFGIKPISKAGLVKVKDELRLDWRLRATAH